MARKSRNFVNTIISSFAAIIVLLCGTCSAEYLIMHSASNTHFIPDAGTIDLSEVPKVVLASFGFDINRDLEWKGLSQGNVFKRPKAHAIISVEGVEDGQLNMPCMAKYPLNNDISMVDTDMVRSIFQEHVDHGSLFIDFNEYSHLYDITSTYPKLFSKLPSSFTGLKAIFTQGNSGLDASLMGSLNASNEADIIFLGEMYMIIGAIDALKSTPEVSQRSHPDFLHMRVSGINNLVKEYGSESTKVKDAIELLKNTIEQLTSDLRAVYHDNVVVQVVVYKNEDNGLGRKARSLMQAAPGPTQAPIAPATIQQQLNLAPYYSQNYGVMFNIFFWLVVGLIIVIYFIANGIWCMDPGRDSIIYRMTSQRLKRE